MSAIHDRRKRLGLDDPLLRVGQGEYERTYTPRDFAKPDRLPEGAGLITFVFLATFFCGIGVMLGAWLF